MEEQSYDTVNSGLMAAMGTIMFVCFAIALLVIIAMWKIFTKAGKPGWAAIIPIYSTIVMLEIVGKPVLWLLWLFIPLVNIVFGIMLIHELSKSFGKDVGMTLLLLFFPFIGYPVLGFGDAKYVGPGGKTA